MAKETGIAGIEVNVGVENLPNLRGRRAAADLHADAVRRDYASECEELRGVNAPSGCAKQIEFIPSELQAFAAATRASGANVDGAMSYPSLRSRPKRIIDDALNFVQPAPAGLIESHDTRGIRAQRGAPSHRHTTRG